MAIASTIMAIGMGISTVAGIAQASAQASSQKKQMRLQERAQEIEAARTRRQAYRDMLKAQAMSETSAANSGALNSSAVEGGLYQAANSGFQTIRDINQNREVGREVTKEKMNAASQNSMFSIMQGVGQGLTSLGGSKFMQSGTSLFK